MLDISEKSLLRAEAVGFPVALVVLVFVFGAMVAAGLPLLMGLLAILLTLAGAFLLGHFVPVSVFVENIASMIGLGVGIDYSLFAVNRYRYERRLGKDPEAAAVATVAHAGKAVAFSSLTVIIGLSSRRYPQARLSARWPWEGSWPYWPPPWLPSACCLPCSSISAIGFRSRGASRG